MPQNTSPAVGLQCGVDVCAAPAASYAWSVAAANPWLILGALALLLAFLYAITRLVLGNRKIGEDANVRLLWIFRAEVLGSGTAANDMTTDQLSGVDLPQSERPGDEGDTRTDQQRDAAAAGEAKSPEGV
jgi:hypothetical protein